MPCKKKNFSKTSKCCYVSLFFGGISSSVAVLFCSIIFLVELLLSQCDIIYYSYKINLLFSARDSDASKREALRLVGIPAQRIRIQRDLNSREAPLFLGILVISKHVKSLVRRECLFCCLGVLSFVVFFLLLLFFTRGGKKKKRVSRGKK